MAIEAVPYSKVRYASIPFDFVRQFYYLHMLMETRVSAPPAEQVASGSPLEGGEDNYLDHLNPKHETN